MIQYKSIKIDKKRKIPAEVDIDEQSNQKIQIFVKNNVVHQSKSIRSRNSRRTNNSNSNTESDNLVNLNGDFVINEKLNYKEYRDGLI